MLEVWKSISSYNGKYEVSNHGRVRSFQKKGEPHILSLCSHTRGYLTVYLYKNPKERRLKHFVHRLVARAFIPNPKSKEIVNHIDCNKQNNQLANLEWMTAGENTRYYFETRDKVEADGMTF